MEFNIIRKTMLEVYTKRFIILISYKTPVACYDRVEDKWYRTTKKISRTTSRHIKEWARKYHGADFPFWNFSSQSLFDGIFEEV